MRALVYQLHLCRPFGVCKPSENADLIGHPGVRFGRVFRVTWRRR